jgi:hypothetical protein
LQQPEKQKTTWKGTMDLTAAEDAGNDAEKKRTPPGPRMVAIMDKSHGSLAKPPHKGYKVYSVCEACRSLSFSF